MEIMVEGIGRKITISPGVALLITTKEGDPEELIKATNCTLYEVKKAGKNRVFLSDMI